MHWFRVAAYNFTAAYARIDIYDTIGEMTDWWTGEKTGLAARDFSATLQSLQNVKQLEVHINSRGGSVYDGLQIYNELKRHDAEVTVYIDGQAASIASVIAMAGDKVIMPRNTSLWVHNPMSGFDAWINGYSEDMRDVAKEALHLAEELDIIKGQLLDVYVTKAGDKLDREEMSAMLDNETHITAAEALEFGLCDEIEDAEVEDPVVEDPVAAIRAARDSYLTRAAREVVAIAARRGPPDRPEPMAAHDVVVECKQRGVEALALYCIEHSMNRDQVIDLAKSAGELASVLAAAGADSIQNEAILAMPKGAVEVARVIISNQAEQDINGTLPTITGASNTPTIDSKAIYAKRKEGLN